MNKYYIDDYDKYFWEKYEDKRQLSDIEQIELEIDLDLFFKYSPVYKKMILLYIDGYSIKEIATQMHTDKKRVSQVIRLYQKLI